MLSSSSSTEWSDLADPILIAGVIAFMLLYGSGFTLLRVKNAWTLRRYIAMETFSCLPPLGALLMDSSWQPEAVAFVILAWPTLPIGLALPFLFGPQVPPDAIATDQGLRWNLRKKQE
jgi:hypothetical protein